MAPQLRGRRLRLPTSASAALLVAVTCACLLAIDAPRTAHAMTLAGAHADANEAGSSMDPLASFASTRRHATIVSDPYLARLHVRTFEEHMADVQKDLAAGTLVDRRTPTEKAQDALGWHELERTRTAAASGVAAPAALTSTEREAFLAAQLARTEPFAYSPPPLSWDPRADHYWSSVCPSIFTVRDQGDCDADWAATVASAWSDRLCRQTNGTAPKGTVKDISVEDILSCCGWKCGLGCNGGYSTLGWTYIEELGAVTGSAWNMSGPDAGCLPYTLPPCHLTDVNGTARACDAISGQTQTPTCPHPRRCQNGHDWEAEKYYSFPPYLVPSVNMTIESEIYNYGSVTATIDLYKDFLIQQYPNGVYQHNVDTTRIGSLTIKLIGYGTSVLPYWIAAPTWGPNWGPTSNGFFRIARHTGESNVESAVIGAKYRPWYPMNGAARTN